MNREAGASAISFQCDSGTMNSSNTSEMIQIGNYFVMNTNNTNSTSGGGGGNMLFSSGNSSNNHPLITHQPLASSLLLDSVPGLALKHDTGLAVEWSLEEQYKLEQGLEKYLIHNSSSFLLLFLFVWIANCILVLSPTFYFLLFYFMLFWFSICCWILFFFFLLFLLLLIIWNCSFCNFEGDWSHQLVEYLYFVVFDSDVFKFTDDMHMISSIFGKSFKHDNFYCG